MTSVVVPLMEKQITLIRGHRVMFDSTLAELYGVETRILVRAVQRNRERFPGDFMFQLTAEEFEALRYQLGTSKGSAELDPAALRSQIGISNVAPEINPAVLRSQLGTSNVGRGGRRYRPYVFTEQGVAMLSSVLRSDRAIQVNIEIMRAFVRLRGLLAANADLARRLDELESRYDTKFKVVFDAIRLLMEPPDKPKSRLGFKPPSSNRDG